MLSQPLLQLGVQVCDRGFPIGPLKEKRESAPGKAVGAASSSLMHRGECGVPCQPEHICGGSSEAGTHWGGSGHRSSSEVASGHQDWL